MTPNKSTDVSKMLSSKKVALYIRVSTHWQVDKDSLQVQERELIAYCELVLGIKDYVIFTDPGYSAKNTDRPAYQAMMSRLRTGEFSHLLVWKIDRISRNLLDFASMYSELKRLGVIFVSKNEQFDTSNAIGEAMLKIILVFAELERNMTSERVSAVMLSRASNGQWNGGRVPYGYIYNKQTHSFSLDPVESAVVVRIFDTYEEKQSSSYIADMLNKEGCHTRSGNSWSGTTIHAILTNPFYYGAYRYNIRQGTNGPKRTEADWVIVNDHHVPLIDKQRFDEIQYRLRLNKRGGNLRGTPIQKKHFHIFSGLLECGCCGSKMTATPGKRRADGWTPSVYGCYKRRKSSQTCKSKYVSDVTLTRFVIQYLSNIILLNDSKTKCTSTAILEKKLLRGSALSDVSGIEKGGLNQLLSLMQNGSYGIEYSANTSTKQNEQQADEYTLLEEQRRKHEIAMNRLNSLFLYGESEIPEKDFILERKRITDAISEIDARQAELQASSVSSQQLSDDAFSEQASYFIMVESILKRKYDDLETYIRNIDNRVIKSFVNAIISKIVVTDGLVTEIKFKNGMSHKFMYK